MGNKTWPTDQQERTHLKIYYAPVRKNQNCLNLIQRRLIFHDSTRSSYNLRTFDSLHSLHQWLILEGNIQFVSYMTWREHSVCKLHDMKNEVSFAVPFTKFGKATWGWCQVCLSFVNSCHIVGSYLLCLRRISKQTSKDKFVNSRVYI